MMQMSPDGFDLLKELEGCSLTPYPEPGDTWSIGYGHNTKEKPEPITAERAIELLREDVTRYENAVNAALKVPVTQNEFDALCCLAFNIGPRAFAGSTLLKKLNAGYRNTAAAEFLRWVMVGGEPSEGLKRRRRRELELFARAPGQATLPESA